MDGKQLTDIQAIRKFITAGRATFTLVSKKTGARFTYKFKSPRENPEAAYSDTRLWVSVLTGSDNESSYTYLGFVEVKHLNWKHATHKSPISPDAPSVRALDWFLSVMRHGNLAHLDQVEVWHEGSCARCGRKLTVPASIASGFGPECINHV